ncbi:hypothetical protein JX265_011756 [Neoarthrinium moseri]|uniref:DUF4267 domain containing protein n=1 Tax=Neoarthrinium moseri TaxID=1658444 RepID=A0A9P9WC38_9PEZI|nr:hypothetical protein JX266_005911 [Neoarthrinium moseri]KAI1856244.1 hypothetical protein JX265_011756 [Neoarthrinium moseri]
MSSTARTEYFATATFLTALAPTLLGINAILRPASALSLLKFPAPSQPEGQKITYSLMRIYGARTLTMGLTTLIVWARGDRTTLGYLMFAGIPVALVDGFVSRWQIGGGEWGHWGFIGVSLGLSAGLLGYI